MSRHRCECGRPAVGTAAVLARSGRAARAGRPVARKGHPMCGACWRRANDSWFGNGGVAVARKDKDKKKGQEPASDDTMFLLQRLWAGDTVAVRDGVVVLVEVRSGKEHPADAAALDELEFGRRWVAGVCEGERVRVTFAGRQVLRMWLARVFPAEAGIRNTFGDELSFAGVPGRRTA